MHFIDTVYNGIDVEKVPFSDKGESEDLVYISRLDEQKGSHLALEVSLKLKKRIKIIGRPETENPYQYKYYLEKVKPLLQNSLVHYYGELSPMEKMPLLLSSKLFIFPLCWEEPFGLVMIEAMATGTPIVAFARGAVPEMVEDGVTGFIVNSSSEDNRGDWVVKKTGVEGLREAVERIYAMGQEQYQHMRVACRKRVADRFTKEKMVEGYIDVYRKILGDKI